MKTIKLICTLLACVFFTGGFATNFPKMKVIPIETNKALVVFEALSPSRFEITVCNENGDVVYFKRSSKKESQYNQLFDFSEYGKGTYNICYNYGNQSINRKITISQKNIKVGSPERYYEPYFSLKNEKLDVSFFNVSGKKVWLNIYNNEKHLASQNLGKKLAIHKRLDISRLQDGEYKVVLTDSFTDHVFMVGN